MQDEALTAEMLRLAEPGGCLTISTAYLNLARPFERALASASKVSTLKQCNGSSPDFVGDAAFRDTLCWCSFSSSGVNIVTTLHRCGSSAWVSASCRSTLS